MIINRSNLLFLLCSEGRGKLTVFAMKSMLATMCGGKIVDKLRCKDYSRHEAPFMTSETKRMTLISLSVLLSPSSVIMVESHKSK